MKELPIQDGVQEIHLKDWKEFFDLATKLFSIAPAFIYRGQTDFNWPMQSKLDRLEVNYPKRKNLESKSPEYFSGPPLHDKEHLQAFMRAACGRRGPTAPSLSDDDWWALGQHHGLATRLLDWTRSPWVALFFAFEQAKRPELQKNDALETWTEPEFRGIYALSWHIIEDGSQDIDKMRVVAPLNEANQRLNSQMGLFVHLPRHTTVEEHIRSKHTGRTQVAYLKKIRIPNDGRDDCLVALSKMNINYMTLFPDLDGAARHVNSLWEPGHEDSIAYV